MSTRGALDPAVNVEGGGRPPWLRDRLVVALDVIGRSACTQTATRVHRDPDSRALTPRLAGGSDVEEAP
jgi:hypothetical protein